MPEAPIGFDESTPPEVRIGMDVKLEITRVDDELVLPLFRPAS
jgi:hypothetical protein